MDLFDLSIEEFKKEMSKFIKNMTKEELLQELIECGLKIEDKDK